MDFYQIGAIKVFSQLGQLIEEDEIKLSDLPIDIMQKIGSYLLQDQIKLFTRYSKIDQMMIYKSCYLVR